MNTGPDQALILRYSEWVWLWIVFKLFKAPFPIACLKLEKNQTHVMHINVVRIVFQ